MPRYELDDVTPIYPSNIVKPQLVYTGTDDTGTENYTANLQPVGVSATRKKKLNFIQKIGKFINDEILMNKNGVRTANIRANPNAMDNYQVAQNVGEAFNILSAGIPNRLSLTQNIGLVKDAVNGKNIMESWFGNSGIVSDKYAAEHPWLSMAANMGTDIVIPYAAYKSYPVVKDNVVFTQKPNSFTRGIGGIQGLNDLVESGLVRGNPVGTEVSANNFGKLYRRNRNHFRDIIDDTNIDGIANRYFNRSLTREDFNALKKSSKKYTDEAKANNANKQISDDPIARLINRTNYDPLIDYETYDDYIAELNALKKSGKGATSYNAEGHPAAYFYDDGRNPLTQGHDYANSRFGVRIENASEYNPSILSGHLHYSLNTTPRFNDPNVSVYMRGPLNTTIRVPKSLLRILNKNNKIEFNK